MARIILILLTLSLLFTIKAQGTNAEDDNTIKPVLIVIDTQNAYMKYMDQEEAKVALEMINWAMSIFKSKNLPVVLVYHTDPQMGPPEDSEAFQFDPYLNIDSEYPKVVKNYPNAFKKTELDKIIKELGGNTLFLCGLSAVGCVIATYHGAIDNDYEVLLIEDALISHDAGKTAAIENIFNSVNLTIMKMLLKNTQ